MLEINEEYTGENTARRRQVFVKYFSEPSALKLAVENGEVDVAWRSLSPTGHHRPEGQRRRHGRHRRGLGDPLLGLEGRAPRSAKQLPIRQAVAQVFDREAIAQDAYDGTVEPLYSIVPPGYAGQKDAFQEVYGEPDAARPQRRSSTTPASTPRWTSRSAGRPRTTGRAPRTRPTRSSVSSRRADSSTSTLKSTEWEQYQTISKEGAYDIFVLRLVPRLPGHRRLPVAVPDRRRLLPEQLRQPGGRAAHRRRSRQPMTRPSARHLRTAAGHRRRGRPVHPVLGRTEHRRLRRRHRRRRGDARPGVHLPVLAGQQERLIDDTWSWGANPDGCSPRPCAWRAIAHDSIRHPDPCPVTSCSASCS